MVRKNEKWNDRFGHCERIKKDGLNTDKLKETASKVTTHF